MSALAQVLQDAPRQTAERPLSPNERDAAAAAHAAMNAASDFVDLPRDAYETLERQVEDLIATALTAARPEGDL